MKRIIRMALMALVFAFVTLGVGSAVAQETAPPASSAPGATPDINGFFDQVTNKYSEEAKKWIEGTTRVATRLLGYLAIISFALAIILKYLQYTDNFTSIPALIIKQTMLLSFFLWCVQHSPDLFAMILSYFKNVAGEATGIAHAPTSSEVVSIGMDCMFRILESVKALGWADKMSVGLIALIVALLIVLMFVAVAVTLMMTIIEATIVMAIAPAMLAFGALSYTRDFAIRTITFGITVGVKLLVLHIIIYTGESFAQEWAAVLTFTRVGQNFLGNSFLVLGGAISWAVIAWFVPKLAGSIVSGQLSLGAGDMLGVAGAAAGGAALGAGLGGAAAQATGSSAKGATQALIAGTQLAQAQGATGLGAVAAGAGHAMKAAASEVGQGMRAAVGAGKRSTNSQDQFGKTVGNFGTRAANNLDAKTQAVKETGAAAPTSAAGSANAGATTGAPGAGGEQGNAGTGTAGATGAAGNNADGAVAAAARAGEGGAASSASGQRSASGAAPAGENGAGAPVTATQGGASPAPSMSGSPGEGQPASAASGSSASSTAGVAPGAPSSSTSPASAPAPDAATPGTNAGTEGAMPSGGSGGTSSSSGATGGAPTNAAPTPPTPPGDVTPKPLHDSRPHEDAGAGHIQQAIRNASPPSLPHDGGAIQSPGLLLNHDDH